MTPIRKALRPCLMAALVVTSLGAAAQAPAPPGLGASALPPADGARRPPPPEAIAACKGLKPDQACSFTSPKGTEKGSCVQRDLSRPMSCRPARRGPPPESMAVCKERKLNEACSFVSPEGKETGTCVPHEPGAALGCRPNRR